jgi:anti-sigma factor RsiW
MINCESMTDRMPAVLHGQSDWSREEAAHLAACADCQREWRLLEAARRLGESSAARLDPAQLGAAVLVGLDRERRRHRWRNAGWVGLLAAAAVLVVLVWTGRSGREGTEVVASTAHGFHLPLAELEGLDAAQLESVLDALDAPIGTRATPEPPALGDLEESQLEQVLRSLEG